MSKEQYKFIKKFVFVIILLLAVLSFYMYFNNKNKVVIATKNLTEQKVVANMLKEVIERDTDLEVEIKSGMDSTSFIHNAIIHDDIDMYVEYSSVSFLEIFKQKYASQSSDEIIDYIKKEYEEQYDLRWITTLGFDNSNVLLCNNFCEENNVNTYSDLQNVDFTFGAPVYFYQRSDGYNLLEDNYNFGSNVNIKKLDPILVYVALDAGDIDLGLGFSTDAKLVNSKLTPLTDDKHIFPIYDAGIVVSNNCLKKHSEMEDILLKFNNVLSNDIIKKANKDVEDQTATVQEVAHNLVVELNL